MVIARKPAPNPSPSGDEAKLGRTPTQPPAELTPDHDTASRPGGKGKGSRRVS
jgi:hypothetical protein